MPTGKSAIFVGRRYLERGFVDAAMKLFLRNAGDVEATDWSQLAESLMERNRVPDVVRVCEQGAIPLPRERMLSMGDVRLQRRDIDSALRLYELADADRERWTRMLDALSGLPDRERQAIDLAERHLGSEDAAAPTPRMRVVK